MPASTKFHWKVFISFYVVFSFLALAVSGIVLYVAPPGRVANWSVWQLLFLTKAQWQAVHTIVALAFLVAGGFHVYFNWKVLVAYLKSKLQSGLRMKRELAAASLTGVAILAVSMTGVPPFGTVMDVGEEIKNSWSTSSSEPPVPHAELMTVEKLAETVKIPVAKALANLEATGVKGAQPAMIVQQVADGNGLTPQQVYERIQSEDAKPKVSMAEGGGWGRMSVQQVCERYSIPVETGVARLQAAGFDVQATAMIRDLGSARGKTPIDIAKIVVGDDGMIPSPEAAGPGVTGGPGRGPGGSRQ
jgi:hypothetical protein